MKINVSALIGDVCMTFEDGVKLNEAYRRAFDAGEVVELDFAGTRIFVSQFFNAAVGLLLESYSVDDVRERLKFTNLPEAAKNPLRRSVENAERYFKDPAYRKVLDQVLSAQAVEA